MTGDGLVVDIDDAGRVSGDIRATLLGELDVCTAPTLTAALTAWADGPESAAAPFGAVVHLDLSRLAFMDTSGLTGLIDARLTLLCRGWRVCAAQPQPQIAWLLAFAAQQGWLPKHFLCAGAVPVAPVLAAGGVRSSPPAPAAAHGAASARESFFGSVRVDDDHMTVTVTVAGEIDMQSVGRFRAVVDAGVAANLAWLVLDVGAVEFAGLCMVPVLERAAAQQARGGGHLVVRLAPPAVLRLFKAAGLDDAVEVQSDPSVRRADVVALADAPFDRGVLDAALALLVTLAQAVIAGADGVSITVPRQARWGTVASSNAVVLQMDGDQYATGQGPCLDAARTGERFEIEELAAESRWPAFVPRAQERGIECILSTPLLASGQLLGALNIYGLQAGAFGPQETEWADAFAAEAASLLATGPTRPRGHTFAEQVLDGLRARETTAVATGVVMQRDSVSAAQATATLQSTSVAGKLRVRHLCEELVAGAGREAGTAAHRDPEGLGA